MKDFMSAPVLHVARPPQPLAMSGMALVLAVPERCVNCGGVTQIMNLLCLAPDIQEAILFLPLRATGNDRVKEWQVRRIAAEPSWVAQRRMWHRLFSRSS